jgi:hypothetical protein
MYEDTKDFIRRCGAYQRHRNINSIDVMPVTNNLQIELFDVQGIDYMGQFPKSKNYEYILVAVDYISKWVEAMPCRATDPRSTKKMFKEIIFPRFVVSRMVISDGGSHFIDKSFQQYLSKHGIITMSLLCTTLRQVARQKHQISKLRIFFRRRSMKWEQHERTSYPMLCGHTERPIKHRLECHHTNLSIGKPVTCLLS